MNNTYLPHQRNPYVELETEQTGSWASLSLNSLGLFLAPSWASGSPSFGSCSVLSRKLRMLAAVRRVS